METNGKMTSEQPKRRACDECRSRKLACSKEVDGCARCKREGIKCVYSPQKRMGRPRKHRPVEASAPQTQTQTQTQTQPQNAVLTPTEPRQEEVAPIVVPDFEFDPTLAMDLDLSFLDMNNMDMNFLEIVDPNTQFPPAPDQLGANQGTTAPAKAPEQTPNPSAFWPMGTGLADINFDGPLNPSVPPAPEVSQEDLAHIMSADLAETVPSLSPPSSSPSAHASPPESETPKTCNCVTALYLALDSLKTLPREVGEAMCVARTATKTAHDTILCPVCGDPPIEPTCKPPMLAMQSVMMLGALLPSLSNAYMRILSMVDAEMAAADRERRKIRFTLSGYGGLWGWMAKMDPVKCGASQRLEGAELEPILWRLTVRALLKMDVYGINELTPGVDACEQGAQQPGLKDIINMMEERSRRRHELLDAMVASGEVVVAHHADYVPLADKPTCMRIIDIAKRSMDDLVIP